MVGRLREIDDRLLVTRGAGFIGSNFILQRIASERARILNLPLDFGKEN
jgi:dTDP-D-glucose 4,6-dehydratase